MGNFIRQPLYYTNPRYTLPPCAIITVSLALFAFCFFCFFFIHSHLLYRTSHRPKWDLGGFRLAFLHGTATLLKGLSCQEITQFATNSLGYLCTYTLLIYE